MEEYVFSVNSGHFSLSVDFSWSNCEQLLVGINCLVFWKELITQDSFPIPPHIQYHLLWMEMAIVVVDGGSFCLPQDLFHSTLLYSIHFSLPITICIKKENIFITFQ